MKQKNEVETEDRECNKAWGIALCILAIVLITIGYYADKEEKAAISSSDNHLKTMVALFEKK